MTRVLFLVSAGVLASLSWIREPAMEIVPAWMAVVLGEKATILSAARRPSDTKHGREGKGKKPCASDDNPSFPWSNVWTEELL